MPIYKVNCPTGATKAKLIGAKNKAQAMRHVASKIITAEVASPTEIIAMMREGVQPENASDDAEE